MTEERFRERSHFHGDGLFGYVYTSLTRPRLSFKETCYRKDRSTVRVWMVDGQDVGSGPDAEAALLLPPVLTEEETAAAAHLTNDWIEDRDIQREIGMQALMSLGWKGVAEWERGKVRRRAA